MANDLENTIRNAAYKFAKALEDASELEIETLYVEVGDQGAINFEDARPVAKTTIQLDGDMNVVIPMTRSESGALERDDSLLQLHLENVDSATSYRTDLLEALLSLIRSPRTR
jgi:hypothetical protein